MSPTAESARLEEASTLETIRLGQQTGVGKKPWRKWGPYLASANGVRSARTTARTATPGTISLTIRPARAYHWGEDGLAGISDAEQLLCFSVALWNGKDPILKERMFGLTNSEANHGEDVKEYYFYLDSTPTHSYMKYLYKYPQAEYPYGNLIETNRGAHAWRYGVRTAGYRRLRRGSLLRCLRGVCQAVAGRHAHPDQRQ